MNQIYYGRDPYLIAYLHMRYLEEVSIEWDGGQIVCLFEDTQELQREIDNYFNGKSRVPPKNYADAVRNIFREFRILKNGRGRDKYEPTDPGKSSNPRNFT